MACDLAAVRVHDGPPAAGSARQARAHAYTWGSHIVLGPAAQRAAESARHAVLAHELVHAGQQALETTGAAANGAHWDHAARAPPTLRPVPTSAPTSAPTFSPAPLGLMRLSEDDDSILPAWASEAAASVADMGAGAVDMVADTAGDVAGFALDSAAAVVDRLAPGLLPFLRGGALAQLSALFCGGIDSLLGRLFSALGETDAMSAIEAGFTSLTAGVQEVHGLIASTASDALGLVLGPLVQALQAWGGPLVETIQSLATGVHAAFSGVWEHLAVPALGLLEQLGGTALAGFNRIVSTVWDLCEPLRNGAQTAWNWLMDTFDLAWDSTAGLRTWLGEMADQAWTALLETVEPVRGPLQTAGGIAILLSPLGPLLLLTQLLPPLWEKLTWLWQHWNSADILVRAQDMLRDDILPGLLQAFGGAASAVAGAGAWLASLVGSFSTAMQAVLGVVGANACLATVNTWLAGVADQFNRLAAWADSGFAGLSDALAAVFDALVAFFAPILDVLVRLFMVSLNPPLLPLALTAAIWLLCPPALKPPVILFVLDLLTAFVDAAGFALVGLGPMGLVLQAGVLGFLRQLRGNEGMDDDRRVAACDKIASLLAGGGPAFVLGFSLGFLHGVLDGVIDPFRLIFLIAQVLVAGAMAIDRALAPRVLAALPGAADAAPALREALALPPATAPPAAASTGGAADALPPITPQPGDASDAEVAAALGPGTAAEIAATAAGEAPVDDTALAAEMDGELRDRGATVTGLAQLVGDAWDSMLRGADGMGRAAARGFVEFILQGDFALGRQIGFVCGYVALQALVIYLTMGGYAALEATAPLWRQLLALFLRFLDLGGELLGLVGRAMRPLRGPLLRGLASARGVLGRFRFARGLIERIERLAGLLFRFGDEAAEAGGRGARAVTGETADASAGRVASQADGGAVREAGTHVRVQAADDLGPGALRAADEPNLGTLRNEALRVAELPRALAEAVTIKNLADAVPHNPVQLALGALMLLKRRYRWIDTFTARPLGPGLYALALVASPPTPLGRYTVDDGLRTPEERVQALAERARALGFEPDQAQLRRLQQLAEADPQAFDQALARAEAGFDARAANAAPAPADLSDEAEITMGRGIDPAQTSTVDKVVGSPRSGQLTGDLGEAVEAAAAGASTLPPTFAQHLSPATRADLREIFSTHGEDAMRSFVDRLGLPPNGLRQVEIPVPTGTRRIDRLYRLNGQIVLVEVKHYPNAVLGAGGRIDTELANDLFLLGRFPDTQVVWALSGNVRADFLQQLIELEQRWGGRFRVTLGDATRVVP